MAKNVPLKANSMLGSHKILGLIGEGGMGEVYEAIDETLGRRVAIKVISHKLLGDEIFVKRFLAEGKTLARLNHQNVVTVYALGDERGIHYIVMEYIDGQSLDRVSKSRTLHVDEVLSFVKQILSGVKALHESGIIHRDLKPKNILVNQEGLLKIVDFGVAKTDGHTDPEITSAGMLVGSVSYMAPEIVTGQPASFQSDIWSTGIIFYELLYGFRPFAGDNPLAVLDKIKSQPLQFSEARRPDVPEALRKIIGKMCEKAFSRRYPTVDDILYDISLFESRKAGRAPPPRSRRRLVANEQEVRRLAEQAGFSTLESTKVIEAALEIQELWGDLNPHNSQTGVRISQTAVAAAMNRLRRQREPTSRVGRLLKVAVGVCALAAAWYYLGPQSGEPALSHVKVSKPIARPRQVVPPLAKVVAKALSPVSGQEVWISKNEPVRLEWTGASGANVVLQVATDKQFKNIIAEVKNPSGTSQSVSLNEDSLYHWRLIQQRPNGKTVDLFVPNSFYVSSRVGPELGLPENEMRTESLATVSFNWEEVGGVEKFRFQLASDREFKNIVKDVKVDGQKAEAANLPTGNYYWRVTALGNPALNNVWSENRVFQVFEKPLVAKAKESPKRNVAAVPAARPTPAPTPAPAKPTLKKPIPVPVIVKLKSSAVLIFREGVEFKFPASIKKSLTNAPTLKWKKSKLAASYEVQVSKSTDFTSPEWSQVSRSEKIQWNLAKPGIYFWRVRAQGKQNELSAFSKSAKLDLKLAAPKMQKAVSRMISSAGSGGNAVPVTWGPVPGASFYKLIIGTSQRFDQVIESSTHDQPSADIQLKGNKQYFAKVAALGEDGQQISEFSSVSEITVRQEDLLKPPIKKMPQDGVSLVQMVGGQTPIVFVWEAVAKAQGYTLEIAKDKKFATSFYSLTTAETKLLVNKPLPTGKIYWRVRAQSPEGESQWSPASTFEISK